jgi:hypothetical protein
MVPDMILDDLDPADSNLLILPGADMWDAGGGTAFATAAARYLDAAVPVAAICGATAGSSELVSWATAATPALEPGTSWPPDMPAVTTASTNAQSWTGISSRSARSRLCSSRSCDAALGPGIGSQARGVRGVSTGPTRPLTQRSWTPKTQHECCPQGTPLFRRVKAGRSRRLRRKPAHYSPMSSSSPSISTPGSWRRPRCWRPTVA